MDSQEPPGQDRLTEPVLNYSGYRLNSSNAYFGTATHLVGCLNEAGGWTSFISGRWV
jgi:hypothetical protein